MRLLIDQTFATATYTHPVSGGAIAAPIAKSIFDACGELGYLPAPAVIE